MNRYLLVLLVLLFAEMLPAQCPSGAMAVTGAGCGCLAGCDLTSFGGPNCGGGVGGNCSAGYVTMTPVDINVPAGCTFTVTATMANRPGCSSSGADGSCQTCDVLKVDLLVGGAKAFQQGASNATLTDSYVLSGWGTVRISGSANRADEIITYSVAPGGCAGCVGPLPIELTNFQALPQARTVNLTWATNSEINNDYFTVERSADGEDFEAYGFMKGRGNADDPFRYQLTDASPVEGISYYRLKQTDFDGNSTLSETRTVYFHEKPEFSLYPNPANGEFELAGKHIFDAKVSIADVMGKPVITERLEIDNHLQFDCTRLAAGLYFVRVTYEDHVQVLKLVVKH